MGELWRSQLMQQVQLFVQIEAARDTVDEIGKLGVIQFRDLNPEVNAFQRTFVNEVKRFDEMERKVRYFEGQVEKNQIDREALSGVQVDTIDSELSSKVMIDELEGKFDELEKELLQMNTNQETLDRNLNELIELRHVLDKDAFFFDETDIQRAEEDETRLGGRPEGDERLPLVEGKGVGTKSAGLGFVTGVILRDKLPSFERVLWRATRGNMFLKQTSIDEPIKDPHTGENVNKNVFIIFFQGARAQAKIKKICESYGANLYTCPETVQARTTLRNQVEARLTDLRVVLSRTQEHSKRVLMRVAANLENWKTIVIKEKSIFHTMNMFNYDVGRKCLIAEGWCPTSSTEEIQLALRRATERSGAAVPSILSIVQSHETPPTYHKTNKFTEGFQNIVDAYGVARYREINPTVFTIITFPFLFGVMFGDVGHGFFLLLFAAALIWKEKQLSSMKLDEMVGMLFGGRYLLLLMGLFAMYCGLIYNEFFTIPASIFSSSFTFVNDTDSVGTLLPGTSPYLFGVDPKWKYATNELYFYNSLKMKTSIILGVSQMCLGIFLSLLNAIYFKKPYNYLFEFIPQILFMLCTFGYLCFLVVYKWSIDWNTAPADLPRPSLLNLMIKMFLSPQHVPPEFQLYNGQYVVQVLFLAIAIICVPVMLLAKPLFLLRDHKKQLAAQEFQVLHEEEEHHAPAQSGGGGHDDEHGEFVFSDIVVHQAIHTIEFVIGAVSNTASYLRLWALSLAHSELASVFLEQVLNRVMSALPVADPVRFVFMFVGFAVWAFLTIAVLLIMESLSAFLHALRLHWVEFQNKFYMGDGYKFNPFSYTAILAEQGLKA